VDRSAKEGALAIGVATLFFTLAVPFQPDVDQVSHVLFGGAIGLALIIVGFAATSRCRPLPPRSSHEERIRLAVSAVGVGAALGLANLGSNLALAALDPSVRDLLVNRFTQSGRLWLSVFGAPVIEEIALRLAIMGGIAWIAAQFIERPRIVFLVALFLSSVPFGLLHIFRPLPEQSPLDVIYAAGVALKSSFAGLLLGWVFWRWGLPYAIICHSMANAAHRLLAPVVF
jgi:hypothetical protein